MRSPFSLVALGAFLSLTLAQDLPIIALPWGKYQAEVFDGDKEIYLFKNVRFGNEPPRFGAPSFPDWENDSIQSPNRNTTCIQINSKKVANPPVRGNPLQDPQEPPTNQTEDCLFLDIYVPKRAFGEEKPLLPVTVWIYGGGYAFGSKEQSGKSALQASNYKSIFVVGNYRVGAFGWLAGDYMQQVGQPNAGLYDQALLFEWVQKYIDQAHGNKNSISAWGESAGAGSILHHLVREDGAVDPNFHTFAALSPGFEWAWDNSPGGKLDTVFRNFSQLAGCEFSYDIDCLRQAPAKDLDEANTKLFELVQQTGLFPVGPSTDGKWIKNLSPISFSEGKYWKNIRSSIISHVGSEGWLFAPFDMDSEAKFDAFLNEFLPGPALANQRAAIKKEYDCKETSPGGYRGCLVAIISHAVFNCNTRDLATAYPGISYMMDYAFPTDGLAVHATDLLPMFVASAAEMENILVGIAKKILDIFQIPFEGWIKDVVVGAAKIVAYLFDFIRGPYQNYFASFALFGHPNGLGANVTWPPVEDKGNEFSNVLKVGFPWPGSAFTVGSDSKNPKAKCSFWAGLAKEIVAAKTTYGDSHGALMEAQYPIKSGNEL